MSWGFRMRASDQGRFVLGCGHGSQEKLAMEYTYMTFFIGWINYTWHMENSIHSNHDGSTQDWFWPVKSRHQNHPPPFFTTLLRNYTKYTFTLRWSIYLSFLLITWRSLYFNNLIKGSRIFVNIKVFKRKDSQYGLDSGIRFSIYFFLRES